MLDRRLTAVAFVVVSLVAGCGGRVASDELSDRRGGAVQGTSADSGDAGEATPSASSDGGEATVVSASRGIVASCTADEGTTDIPSFEGFKFIRSVHDASGAVVIEGFQVNTDCTMSASFGAEGFRVFGMERSDCDALVGWLTSDRWLHALETSKFCPGVSADPDQPEEGEDNARGGSPMFKAPPYCTDPTLLQFHACMQAVIDKYDPGHTL